MIKCEALVEALNGEYNGTYESFEVFMVYFVEDLMKSLCKDYDYMSCCRIRKEPSEILGKVIGTEHLELNKSVIERLFKGDKNALIIVFHELTHVKQNIQLEKGVITPNTIRYIKDVLLIIYQTSENKRLGHFDDEEKFYFANYSCNSKEVVANLNSILLTMRFLNENGIGYTEKEEEKFIKAFKYYEKMENKARYLGECFSFNNYYLPLDEVFDEMLKVNPKWIEQYPQLKAEYYVEDGVIKRRDHIIYEDYDEDDDVCHKFRQLVRQK